MQPHRRAWFSASALGLPLLAVLGAAAPARAFVAPTPPTFVSSLNGYNSVRGVATDASGNLFVADHGSGTLFRYDPLGNYFTSWFAQQPVSVATDAAGSVYYSSDHVFTPLTFKVSNTGASLGSVYVGNTGVAVDAAGNVFTSSLTTHQITKSTNAGAVVTQWGGFGSGLGQFVGPLGVAVDAAGFVYVVDQGNHRVQKFANDGTWVTQWGNQGAGDGQFSFPTDVAIDAVGNVLVCDSGNNRIQRFTKDGIFLEQWGGAGSGNGQFNLPQSIDVSPGGDIYVSDPSNSRVQRFSASGQPLTIVPPMQVSYLEKWPVSHYGIAASPGPRGVGYEGGRVSVAAGNSYGSFDESDGVITWVTPPPINNQFPPKPDTILPRSIRPNPTGSGLYYLDGSPQTATGIHLLVGGPEVLVAASINARFTVDQASHLFVLEHSLVKEYSLPSGAFLRQWGGAGSGNGQFNNPTGIACDGSGFVHVLDTGNLRVQKFDPATGGYLGQVGIASSGCFDLEIDGAGNFYMLNASAPQLRVFAPNGTLLGSFGSVGTGNGQFTNPTDLALGDLFTVYVADASNATVQKFQVATVPQILSLSDVPGDQGGAVQVRFRAAAADIEGPQFPTVSYRIDRQDDGSGVWATLATLPATHAPEYTATVATPATASPTTANTFAYRIRGISTGAAGTTISATAHGSSVDNLAPPPPTGFVSQLNGGIATFLWSANPVADLAGYRVYKGTTPSFFPLPSNLAGFTTQTNFSCPATPLDDFLLVAVDVNGNESTPVPNVPGSVGVDDEGTAPRFALGSAGANPARGGRLVVRLSLPDRRPARLDVCDLAGRIVRTREVAVLGPGTHTVDLTGGGSIAPGLYFVRLTQGTDRRSVRLTVLD